MFETIWAQTKGRYKDIMGPTSVHWSDNRYLEAVHRQ